MLAATIRNLPEKVLRALRFRAAQHNRSVDAEIHVSLDSAALPKSRPPIGTALSKLSRTTGLTNADVEVLEQARDALPAKPMRFE